VALAKTIRSFAELTTMLADVKAPHRVFPDEQRVELTAEPGLPGPLAIRWEKQHPFVQLVQPVLLDVPAERLREVEGAVLRLNHASMFPGLSFDHATSTVYDRVTAVVLVDGVRQDLLLAYIQGLVINARQLRGLLLPVVERSAAPPA
jgi:hypothetical protein